MPHGDRARSGEDETRSSTASQVTAAGAMPLTGNPHESSSNHLQRYSSSRGRCGGSVMSASAAFILPKNANWRAADFWWSEMEAPSLSFVPNLASCSTKAMSSSTSASKNFRYREPLRRPAGRMDSRASADRTRRHSPRCTARREERDRRGRQDANRPSGETAWQHSTRTGRHQKTPCRARPSAAAHCCAHDHTHDQRRFERRAHRHRLIGR